MMGERLGKWILSREIGRGGMGRVYLAQEEVTSRQAAVKILAADLAQEAGFLHRFQREIETLSQLTHPNIVQFYDAGHENGHYYYAMEFVEGQSLEDLLGVRNRLAWRDVLDIALQIGPALKHVHDHGIVHRDLKPSNILVRDDGVLKLTDFGIAKVFSATHLTQTGGVVGTAEYISPEQAAGKPATKRSDIYALGIVFYLLITGRLPFDASGFLDMMHKHRYAQFDRPQRIVAEIPHEIDDLICQMLEKDPAKRPPDCLVLTKQFEAIRKKMDRKDHATQVPMGETIADTRGNFSPQTDLGPGPATLMSRLIREELQRQNAGGPLTRFFNRPIVIVTLFTLCLAFFAYVFLAPTDPEALFRKGAELMASDRLADLEIGWRDYLGPLERDFPDSHRDDVKKFWRKLEKARGKNVAESEAERFYRLGQQRHEQGDDAAAAETWRNLIAAFEAVPAEREWVDQAKLRLVELQSPKAQEDRLARVRPLLDKAAAHKKQGNVAEAEKIWASLESLYRNDPAGGAILKAIDEARKN
jgi:serine/threonine-protein kinase